MHIDHLDFETFSELDVTRVGAFRYAEHPSTQVLIMCWSFDDEKRVHKWTIGEPVSDALRKLIEHVRNGVMFGAHNAQFEYCIWNYVLGRQLGIKNFPALRAKQLVCTAARAAMCSLPRGLERAGAAMNLRAQKDKRGKQLLKLFSGPRKPTKKDDRTRVLPEDEPEKFKEFIEYCQQDVRSERELHERLPMLPPFEVDSYAHDMTMNERGIPIDVPMIKRALIVVGELERRAQDRVKKITKGVRPTQRDRLMEWLADQGFELENLQAATVKKLLEEKKLPLRIRTLLELRVEASKVSTKKLASMVRVACMDKRARGMLLYYGAHTGRASGKLIQPQNFIRGLPDLGEQIKLMDTVFSLLRDGADADIFEFLFDAPLTAIAQCMRGFIRAKPGHRILVVDYSQIEARLLVWLADEEEAIKEYEDYDKGIGHDRYVLMATFLWNIKPEEVSKDQRRIAKNLVLGCGFGLGWKQFIVYCADREGLIVEEDMSKRAVRAFREKHANVIRYWADVERCAIKVVQKPGQRIHLRNVSFYCEPDGSFLKIRLPSGRDLYYPNPQVRMVEKFGMPALQLTFMEEVKRGMWLRVSTYGGRLVENIMQGTARDIMNEGCFQAEKAGYPIVLIVHDELLVERKVGEGSVAELRKLACKIRPWIGNCPLAATGEEMIRYRKAA